MAKKGRNKKSRQPEKDVPPVLPARVWEEICEDMNFSMVNDMPGMGYFPVVDSGIRYKIPENDGNSCEVEFKVSPGFLARLPFAEPERAEIWEKSYEKQIAAAFAKFNGDEEKFALEWEPSFTDCGRLRCKIALHSFNEMNEAVLMATATVLDENGVETGKYNLCSDGLLSNLDVLEDFSEDSIEDFCENICLNALLPDYTFRDEAREVLNKAFMGVSLEFFANSSWEIEERKNWREGLVMFLNPVSPLHVDGPQKKCVESIVGTLENPAFPEREAIYLLFARIADPAEFEYDITVSGPWPWNRDVFAQYPALLRKVLENPENIVFQDKFVPAGVEDGVDPIVTMMLSGKELALKIQKALGAASGEDE